MIYPSQIIESIVSIPRGYLGVNDVAFRKTLVKELGGLGKLDVDEIGNIWLQIGEPNTLLFAAHTDTVDSKMITGRKPLTTNKEHCLVLDNDKIKRMKNKTKKPQCLGADDGAGIATMLCLIYDHFPATYLFTVGEEVGCVGAQWIVEHTPERLTPFSFCIEVDRKGVSEIITHQSTGKCASNEFAESLAGQLEMGHKPSELGVYTDNAHFSGHIEECVNVAAGYYSQHTLDEEQDIKYLDTLFSQLVSMDISQLVVNRDVSDVGERYDYFGSRYSSTFSAVYGDDKELVNYIKENPEEILEILDINGIMLEDYVYIK